MKSLLIFLFLLCTSHNAHALKQEDLLPPDKAFKFSAQAVSADAVQLQWDIADGYYMYRKRFAFNSETEAIGLNTATALFPASKTKQDPNLGEMEVYYQQVIIEVPLERGLQAAAETTLKLTAKFQGCAEAGLCYPPQRKKATLTLAALDLTLATADTATDVAPDPADTTASTEIVPLANLKALSTAANTDQQDSLPLPPVPDEQEMLPLPPIPGEQETLPLPPVPAATDPDRTTSAASGLLDKLGPMALGEDTLTVDQAFQYTLTALSQDMLSARWQVAPAHNLYRTKISFSIISPTSAATQLGPPKFPIGTVVNDEFFGEMEVYDGDVTIAIPLQNTTADLGTLIVETRYQGCSNATGICYPRQQQQTTLSLANLPQTAPAQSSYSANQQMLSVASAANDVTNLNQPQTDDFFAGSFFGILLAFFIVGMGLSLTPCIFPMIPILSGIIAGQNNLSANKAFILSLTYVTASATAYALIGLAFGFFGENLQSSLQNPIAIGLFSALFVVLALSMFGFFDLQMPNSIQSRLNDISNRQRGGSLIGAAIMGFLSTLIVGPCVAPALAAALTYIANSKDALLGASALFSMGFGMGIILLVAGTLGGHLLPKAGVWMDTTKAIFGIMLLGMAIWMLDRIVPIGITLLLTGVLLVSAGIYMGALDKLREDAGGWDRFWKSMGLILLFYGGTQLLGVAAGSTNLLQPLKGIFKVGALPAGATQTTQQHARFQHIKSNAELDSVLADAAQNGQLALLDFYADWCVDCVRMEKNVFTDPAVQAALQNVVLIKADVTKRSELDKALEKRFGIIGPPTIIFFDKKSIEINDLRMIGYENSQQFIQRLQQFTNL